MRRVLCATALAVLSLGLPAAAQAGLIDTYQRLAERRLAHPPLVLTTAPRVLTPLDRTLSNGTTRGARGYSLRAVHYGAGGPDAIVVVTGGEFRTLRRTLREERRLGFRVKRRIGIRGKRGYLLTRRLGPLNRSLVWVERGVVYSVGSGTPRKISLADLRSVARGLDRLERDWFGGSADPDSSSEGFAVTTERTVSVDVSFETTCSVPGSTAATVRVGQASATALRRDGDRFSFEIAQHPRGAGSWTGTVTGTIAPGAITLSLRATGTVDGETCDSGPVTLTLDQRAS